MQMRLIVPGESKNSTLCSYTLAIPDKCFPPSPLSGMWASIFRDKVGDNKETGVHSMQKDKEKFHLLVQFECHGS